MTEYKQQEPLTGREQLIQYLAVRGLYITPAQLWDAIERMQYKGINEHDALINLRGFLHRRTPYFRGDLEPHIFEGWPAVVKELKSMDKKELVHDYASRGIAVASLIRNRLFEK